MEGLFLECTLPAACIAMATAGLLAAMRVKDPAAKHLAYSVVLVLMLLLPVSAAWGPKIAQPAISVVLPDRAMVAPGGPTALQPANERLTPREPNRDPWLSLTMLWVSLYRWYV
jgi:hypothetical protein